VPDRFDGAKGADHDQAEQDQDHADGSLRGADHDEQDEGDSGARDEPGSQHEPVWRGGKPPRIGHLAVRNPVPVPAVVGPPGGKGRPQRFAQVTPRLPAQVVLEGGLLPGG